MQGDFVYMELKLPSGHIVLIDDEDYELICQYSWFYHTDGYAMAEVSGLRCNGLKRRAVLMHKLIMNTPKGMDTDHRNMNGLDNRRFNLRVASRTQNNFNSGIHKNNTSGHRGVCWVDRIKSWRVYIGGTKTRKNLGYYKKIEDAIQARVEAEKIYIDKS